MALSNTFLALLDDLIVCDGVANALKLSKEPAPRRLSLPRQVRKPGSGAPPLACALRRHPIFFCNFFILSHHKTRYYVVWVGLGAGVYDSWEECRLQVDGVKDARYKAYPRATRPWLPTAATLGRSLASSRLSSRTLPVPLRLPAGEGSGYWASLPVYASTPLPWTVHVRAILVAWSTVPYVCSTAPRCSASATRAAHGHKQHCRVSCHDTSGGPACQVRRYLDTYIHRLQEHACVAQKGSRSNTTLPESPKTAKTLDLLRRADRWLEQFGPDKEPHYKMEDRGVGRNPADFGRK